MNNLKIILALTAGLYAASPWIAKADETTTDKLKDTRDEMEKDAAKAKRHVKTKTKEKVQETKDKAADAKDEAKTKAKKERRKARDKD